jgi:Protein of unknown function (DUF2846)
VPLLKTAIAALEQCRDRGRRQVSIDGRIVGSLAAETFLAQPLDPGTHVISFFNNTSQENTEVTVEAGKNYFLRVGMNPAATHETRARKRRPGARPRKLPGAKPAVGQVATAVG